MRNKIFILLFAAFFLCANLVAASCTLNVKLINQDPNPAVPGDYVKLLFKVSGLENPECNGAALEIEPSYPFSLDPTANPIQSLTAGTYTQEYNSNWVAPYKLRVADDALDGDYTLKLAFQTQSQLIGHAPLEGYYTVTVTDMQTSFDVIAQEISGNQVSLGIVNTGKNTANSLVVTVPQQDNFKQIGTTGQIVGNLEAGDYTIVSFNIIPSTQKNATKQESNNMLKVKIDYTDGIGKRRSMTKEVLIGDSFSTGNFTTKNLSQQQTTTSSAWWYVLAIVVIIILAIIYAKYSNKIKRLCKKEEHLEDPEWVKAGRSKKK